jgi:3-oxoacyl-(acyl-carrier-protein) synthase
MPAYHVSANFDVRGPYFVTYPGPAQLYQALEEATVALASGQVDIALVGAVAHQRNFLVEHHFARLQPPTAAEALRDAGAFLVLEREEGAKARGARLLGRLAELSLSYQPFDACARWPEGSEELRIDEAPRAIATATGAAALGVALGEVLADSPAARRIVHRLQSRDGIVASSRWELPA